MDDAFHNDHDNGERNRNDGYEDCRYDIFESMRGKQQDETQTEHHAAGEELTDSVSLTLQA